jgi:hypothetical protein
MGNLLNSSFQDLSPFSGSEINESYPPLNLTSHLGYKTTEGLPSSEPNKILVDTLTIPTR